MLFFKSGRKGEGVKTPQHPYLSGNFAPMKDVHPLTTCIYTGEIPAELAGGQYVRNGGNPLMNDDLNRDVHWFDGDGMLSGVLFRRTDHSKSEVRPEFVNQFILTDVFLTSKTSQYLRNPILPSISTLINPLSSFIRIQLAILRTLLWVALSKLPGSFQSIKKISVANTAMLYHDGRALATCESGPPMRVLLPSLETVGWFNGWRAEGEYGDGSRAAGYGGAGPMSFVNEWTTGHPRVDPISGELLAFHSTFIPPYIHYSISASKEHNPKDSSLEVPETHLNMVIPGVPGAKMMHDFGVSREHTIIMDLPLSLDPLNDLKGLPSVAYDPSSKSRFGVFPRYRPEQITWFETNPCIIFHTANAWDTTWTLPNGTTERQVHLLACRLTSAGIVYNAANLDAPMPIKPIPPEYQEEEQCRLYYYQFILDDNLIHPDTNQSYAPEIRHQWALSAISFEFPTVRADLAMSNSRYVYGCTTDNTSFSASLGRAAKISYLAKFDVQTLIAKGIKNPPEQIKGCVDTRSIQNILSITNATDPIQIFQFPKDHYGQEPRFIPRRNGKEEDDGWIVTYVFDESQLDEDGHCPTTAYSELWIINAKNMKDVVAKVKLPARVPYGLHGNWFSEEDIKGQRDVHEVRKVPGAEEVKAMRTGGMLWQAWMALRGRVERFIA